MNGEIVGQTPQPSPFHFPTSQETLLSASLRATCKRHEDMFDIAIKAYSSGLCFGPYKLCTTSENLVFAFWALSLTSSFTGKETWQVEGRQSLTMLTIICSICQLNPPEEVKCIRKFARIQIEPLKSYKIHTPNKNKCGYLRIQLTSSELLEHIVLPCSSFSRGRDLRRQLADNNTTRIVRVVLGCHERNIIFPHQVGVSGLNKSKIPSCLLFYSHSASNPYICDSLRHKYCFSTQTTPQIVKTFKIKKKHT